MTRLLARPLPRTTSIASIVLVLAGIVGRADCRPLSFRSYNAADGLTSLAGVCTMLAGPGYLLACSEHGLFSYDGRSFRNLGRSQGLLDGGDVDDLALTRGGRVAVRFPDRLFISDAAVSLDHPPGSLQFRAVDLGHTPVFNDFPRQMAAIDRGLAIIVGGRTERVVVPEAGVPARVEPMGYNAAEQEILRDPTGAFQVRARLWETFKDGRVCSADPGFVRCYELARQLPGAHWRDIAAGDGDTVLARSDDALATIDPATGSVHLETLPDQGGAYDTYLGVLGLFRAPNGELVTQSAHGLIVRQPNGWRLLDIQERIAAGAISSVLADRSGQMWIQFWGRGLYRGLGYGHWENLQQEDGLSAGSAWAVLKVGHVLWVATDTGIDEALDARDLSVTKKLPWASFALARGPAGTIWSGGGKADVAVVDPRTGSVSRIKTPLLTSISVADSGRVWLGTQRGLFRVDVRPGQSMVAVADGPSGVIYDLSSDRSGGLWIINQGRLWRRSASGSLTMISGQWPTDGFVPLTLATSSRDHLWIGGSGGLYDVTIRGDRIVSMVGVPQPDIPTNSVVAVMIDHRGWVWAGTGQGVAVFNGHRWVSVDQDVGLVWDDVGQGGLYEDPDGSVWIATSAGVSHLLDPEWLFEDRPETVVISQATLGQATLGQAPAAWGRLAFTQAPLLLQFGTVTFASERSIVFRYMLSGVDRDWVETSTGSVRYPFVPPGRHVLTVVGYNTLTHIRSKPATLVIDMDYPLWRRWWAELLYLAAVLGIGYAALQFRDRASVARERKLEALVEERTRDMRAAQAELRRQATLDGLTGLLNRGEVERRLQDLLNGQRVAGDTVVAMLDIDHFKKVNDKHGHLIGDELLRAIGVRLSAVLRDGDLAGRFGGEEFILVIGDRDGQAAERILLIHQMIRQHPFRLGEAVLPVTCSVGLAWAAPGDTWTTLIGRADAALYEAKASGRNRIVESQDDAALAERRAATP